MMLLYPGPAFSISLGPFDVPAASSGGVCWAPASANVFQNIALGSRQLAMGGQMLTCAICKSGIRSLGLLLATSSGLDLLKLRRRQVGQCRIRLGGWLRGRRPLGGRWLGGWRSCDWPHACRLFSGRGLEGWGSHGRLQLKVRGARSPNKVETVIIQVETSERLLCNQMQTYSVDFFLMALFTRKACRGVSVAGGGVSPASGAVPTTAMVTVVVADGAAPTSSGSVLEDEAEGLQVNTISTSQYQYTAIQQSSKSVPGRFDCFSFPLPHQPTTLRYQRKSFGQLHGWLGGVVPSRLSFSFFLHLGALVLCGVAAMQSLGYASPLCFDSGAGEEVVRPGDVGSRWVAAV
jgi:hypothetical protein